MKDLNIVFKILALTLAMYFLSPIIFSYASDTKMINESDNLTSAGFVPNVRSKNKMYVIEYKTKFTIKSSEIFAHNITKLLPIFKPGDVLVINIESPGGAVSACGHDFDQVRLVQALGVKVVSTTDYIAASCGYQLASAADFIIAGSSALIGNIGVITKMPKRPGNLHIIGSTRTKELLAGAHVTNENDVKILRDNVRRLHFDFIERVSEKRGDKITDKLAAFGGNIFIGKNALKIGLIDSVNDHGSFIRSSHMNGYKIILIK